MRAKKKIWNKNIIMETLLVNTGYKTGARLLQQETNEIVYYNETLDMYLWGVTHYGTSWDYVLTSIKIDW